MYVDILTSETEEDLGEWVLAAIVEDEQILTAMSPAFESSDERPRVTVREYFIHWRDRRGVRFTERGLYCSTLQQALYQFNKQVSGIPGR